MEHLWGWGGGADGHRGAAQDSACQRPRPPRRPGPASAALEARGVRPYIVGQAGDRIAAITEETAMTVVRYSPWTLQNGLQDDLKNAFGRLFGSEDADQSNVVTSQWTPRVDIKEEPDRFVIQADIPGVDPKDIEVHMEKGILTIKGERRTESKTEGDQYTRVERSHGLFYRRFALPDSANPEGITAVGKHGVLEIAIPKRAETKARRIEING
jgi:HSP20 family protein